MAEYKRERYKKVFPAGKECRARQERISFRDMHRCKRASSNEWSPSVVGGQHGGAAHTKDTVVKEKKGPVLSQCCEGKIF